MPKPESSLSALLSPFKTPPPPRLSTLSLTLKPLLSLSLLEIARSVRSSVSVCPALASPDSLPSTLQLPQLYLSPPSPSVKPPSPKPSSTPTTQLPTASTKFMTYQNYPFLQPSQILA